MKNKIIIFSTILLFISIILNWYSDQIFDTLFIFVLIIYVPLFIIYNALMLLSIDGIIRDKNRLFNIISLFILIVIALLTLFFPFRFVKTKLEFNIYEKERNIIIEKIKNNELEIDNIGNVNLPNKYKKISSGGKVFVYENNEDNILIGFWVFRGMLSGSVELIYSSNGEDLIRKNETGHPILSIKKIRKNWYYVETGY